MKNKWIGIIVIGLCISLSMAQGASPNIKFAKEVDHCTLDPALLKKGSSARFVTFIKQWHLLPSDNTHDEKSKKFIPQRLNQVSLYRQLSEWIKLKSLSILLVEGCPYPSEMNSLFPTKFNGWGMDDLKKELHQKTFDELLTHVGLKIETKWKDQVKTICSDDDRLIKKSLETLSDARGDLGYLSRLKEFKSDPEKVKIYLEGAIELYQLSKTTTVDQALAKAKESLADDIKKLKSLNDERSVSLVALIKGFPENVEYSQITAVWGGLHAQKVKTELEKAGIGCSIIEPVGYNQNEEKLISSLEEQLK